MEPISSLEKGSTGKLSRDRVRVRKCRKRIGGGIEKMKNRYFLFIFFSIPHFPPNNIPRGIEKLWRIYFGGK